MSSETADPIERWTAKRRVALVVSILKGESSVAEAARQHGLTVAEVEDWREKFLGGAENETGALVQPGAAASGARVPKSDPISSRAEGSGGVMRRFPEQPTHIGLRAEEQVGPE